MRDEVKVKRKIVCLIALLVLAALAAGCLAACDTDDELPSGTPVSWETYLEQAAQAVVDRVVADGGKIGIKLTAEALTSSGTTDILFGINFDFSDITRSILVLDMSTDGEGMFSLVSTDESTFIDIAPGFVIDDAKLKIENLGLFDFFWATWSSASEEGLQTMFRNILVNLGKTFFDEVDVNAAGDEYVFRIAADYKEKGAEYFSKVLGVLGDTVSAAFLSAFDVDSVAGLMELMPELDGHITMKLGESSVTLDSEDMIAEGTGLTLNADGITGSELFEEYYEYLPEDENSYVHTKLGNAYMAGTVSVYDGDRRAVSYDYELNANMDIMTLALNDAGLESLSEDNFFHFRMMHRCDRLCTEFCDGKLEESSGAVLDIAFSPTDFNSHNVYVSLNLRAIVSEEYLEEVSARTGGVSPLTVPQYILFTLPSQNFTEDSPLYELFTSLYINNLFKTGEFESALATGEEDSVEALVMRLFASSGDYTADRIVFDIKTNEYGMAVHNDIYKRTVYIIADDVTELKDYGTELPLLDNVYVNALEWKFEERQRTTEGDLLTNIYDASGNLVHGVTSGGGYVPMSPEEAEKITDYYLFAKYTEIDKTTESDFYARIIGVEGLDYASREVQEVTFSVSYPNPLYSTAVGDILGGLAETLTQEVTAKIKLADYAGDGPELIQDEAVFGKEYTLTSRATTPPEFLVAQAVISYEGGYTKTLNIIGTSDAVVHSHVPILDINYYSIVESGNIAVTFEFFNNRETRVYTVREPDAVEIEIDEEEIGPYEVGASVYLANMTAHIRARAIYNDAQGGSTSVQVVLRPKDFSINGITLDNSSTNWTSRVLSESSCVLVFRSSANFMCNLTVLGTQRTFQIRVTPQHASPPEFAFEAADTTEPYYFTGIGYNFGGEVYNKTHGETEDISERMYTLTVSVEKGEVNSYGNMVFTTAPAVSYTLEDYRVGGEKVEGNSLYREIEDMLANPISVLAEITFNEAGYYRVIFTLDGDRYNYSRYIWYVRADELPA